MWRILPSLVAQAHGLEFDSDRARKAAVNRSVELERTLPKDNLGRG